MLFPDLLLRAIESSEIPLRFEPGAAESVAKPVTELLRVWLESHQPAGGEGDLAEGQRTLLMRLIGELEGAIEVPE